MLETIKFVGAAVCKKGFHPHMLHFLMHGGRLSATNGSLTISAPFPVDLTCAPHAGSFTKAVASCEGAITLTLESSRLVVRSGKFRSVVPCADVEQWPINPVAGEVLPITGELAPVFKKLLPFVSTDEQRPWSCGVLLCNNSAFATNSIILVEHWLPVAFPVIANIPVEAVREIVRLKIEPETVQIEPHQLTFHLPGRAYVTCKMLTYDWPDAQRIFAEADKFKGPFVERDELEQVLADVSTLNSFAGDSGLIYLTPGVLRTGRSDETCTSIDNESVLNEAAFRATQLLAMKGVAHKVGFGAYPGPVPFFGECLRGVLTCFRI
jgi:hypothetical protein